jgi:hypothetical protein
MFLLIEPNQQSNLQWGGPFSIVHQASNALTVATTNGGILRVCRLSLLMEWDWPTPLPYPQSIRFSQEEIPLYFSRRCYASQGACWASRINHRTLRNRPMSQDQPARTAAAFTARYPDRMHGIYRMPFSHHRHRHPSPSPNPSCHPAILSSSSPADRMHRIHRMSFSPPPSPPPIAFSHPILSILPSCPLLRPPTGCTGSTGCPSAHPPPRHPSPPPNPSCPSMPPV